MDDEPTRQGPPAPGPPPSGVASAGRRATRIVKGRIEVVRTFGELASVGLALVIALVIGALVGYWLDLKLGTSPIFFIVFFLVGLAAGIRNLYVITKKYLK